MSKKLSLDKRTVIINSVCKFIEDKFTLTAIGASPHLPKEYQRLPLAKDPVVFKLKFFNAGIASSVCENLPKECEAETAKGDRTIVKISCMKLPDEISESTVSLLNNDEKQFDAAAEKSFWEDFILCFNIPKTSVEESTQSGLFVFVCDDTAQGKQLLAEMERLVIYYGDAVMIEHSERKISIDLSAIHFSHSSDSLLIREKAIKAIVKEITAHTRVDFTNGKMRAVIHFTNTTTAIKDRRDAMEKFERCGFFLSFISADAVILNYQVVQKTKGYYDAIEIGTPGYLNERVRSILTKKGIKLYDILTPPRSKFAYVIAKSKNTEEVMKVLIDTGYVAVRLPKGKSGKEKKNSSVVLPVSLNPLEEFSAVTGTVRRPYKTRKIKSTIELEPPALGEKNPKECRAVIIELIKKHKLRIHRRQNTSKKPWWFYVTFASSNKMQEKIVLLQEDLRFIGIDSRLGDKSISIDDVRPESIRSKKSDENSTEKLVQSSGRSIEQDVELLGILFGPEVPKQMINLIKSLALAAKTSGEVVWSAEKLLEMFVKNDIRLVKLKDGAVNIGEITFPEKLLPTVSLKELQVLMK